MEVSRKFFQEAGNGHYDIRFYKGPVEMSSCHQTLLAALDELTGICDTIDVKPILMHGALLGWHWNKKLLPWDDDIDLCIIYKDLLKLADFVLASEHCYDQAKYLLEINPNHTDRSTLNLKPGDWSEPNKIDARIIDKETGLFIDITALCPVDSVTVGTKCPHNYQVSDIFPLCQTTLEGRPVYVPSNAYKILSQEYGMEALHREVFNNYGFNSRTNNWELITGSEIENELTGQFDNIFIPTYVINLKGRVDRRSHILDQFKGRPEFEVHIIEACEHHNGRVGLWNSIVNIVRQAAKNEDEVIIICEDDHEFTDQYSKEILMHHIIEAGSQGVNILSGGIGGFNQAIPVAKNRYWIDWFWCTQFIVIYCSFFEAILNEPFLETDTADGKLSEMTSGKMVIHPFLSIQRDFGYSDVTLENDEQPGLISHRFNDADQKLSAIRQIYDTYKVPDGGIEQVI